MTNEYYETRLSKLESYANKTGHKYADKFDKTHSCIECKHLQDDVEPIKCAGRIISLRNMGKLTFLNMRDHTGSIQLAFTVKDLGKSEYDFLLEHIDVGDYIGVNGKMFTTKKGEKTIRVKNCRLLSKSLRPLPEKWHGLSDSELKVRQRYLDLISNKDTWKRFETRNKLIKFFRNYLEDHEFFEVETPILQSVSCGASARPFITHHNSLDIPLYLRIAPETYLKRLIVGGYERVFEIAKCFRNEGIDPSHLQEFTMLEFYAAYWNFRDNMRFVKSMIQELLSEVFGSLSIEYQGTNLDFSGEWPEITFQQLLLKDTGINIDEIQNIDELKNAITNQGIDLPLDQYVSYGSLLDDLYKKYSRPKLIQPVFVTHQPKELVPLARSSDKNPNELDMFQLVVNSWELVKAYSELVDPVEQKKLLLDQLELAKAGDEEAMMLDEDYILSMEYGMPNMSGVGIGIDRMLTLFTNGKNIRDVIYFPSLRPMDYSELQRYENESSE